MVFVKQVFILNRVISFFFYGIIVTVLSDTMQTLTDMFVSTSLSEEKECSELPEQPSAPGDQEERSV